MRDSNIETDPGKISASWINEHLIDVGYDNPRVEHVSTTPIGTGQLARTVRLYLSFAQGNTSFPRSIVAKFPSENTTSLKTATAGGLYKNEVGFYQDLKPQVSIRTPECYYAEIDDSGANFVLLLEDLSTATPGDQIAGCNRHVAQAAVLELAGLHAPTWNKPDLRQLNWMRPVADTDKNLHLFQQHLPGFLNRFKEQLSTEIIKVLEQVAALSSYSKLFSPYSEACLIHRDSRLDNLLIDTSTKPVSIYTVDWQTVAPGNPMLDVALFLGGGLLREARSLHEEAIVRKYHHQLSNLGVTGYDWHRCWNDYRLAAFTGLMTAVNAAMMAERTARGDQLFSTMAHRHARHALDLDSQVLLS